MRRYFFLPFPAIVIRVLRVAIREFLNSIIMWIMCKVTTELTKAVSETYSIYLLKV